MAVALDAPVPQPPRFRLAQLYRSPDALPPLAVLVAHGIAARVSGRADHREPVPTPHPLGRRWVVTDWRGRWHERVVLWRALRCPTSCVACGARDVGTGPHHCDARARDGDRAHAALGRRLEQLRAARRAELAAAAPDAPSDVSPRRAIVPARNRRVARDLALLVALAPLLDGAAIDCEPPDGQGRADGRELLSGSITTCLNPAREDGDSLSRAERDPRNVHPLAFEAAEREKQRTSHRPPLDADPLQELAGVMRRLDALPYRFTLALLFGYWWRGDGSGPPPDLLAAAERAYVSLPPSAARPGASPRRLDLRALGDTFSRLTAEVSGAETDTPRQRGEANGSRLEPDRRYRPGEIAAALGVAEKTVKRWVRAGLASTPTPGGHERVRYGDAVAYAARHRRWHPAA